MQREPTLFDDDFDDDAILDETQLGMTIDLSGDDDEAEDGGLGFRSRYEHPEAVIRTTHRHHAG